MERIGKHNIPAHRLGKKGINQRGNKKTTINLEGAGKLHRGKLCICPFDHYKLYTPQSWTLQKKKAIS